VVQGVGPESKYKYNKKRKQKKKETVGIKSLPLPLYLFFAFLAMRQAPLLCHVLLQHRHKATGSTNHGLESLKL
jgi:hypothetical protein